MWKTWRCMALFYCSDLQTKRNAEKSKDNYSRKRNDGLSTPHPLPVAAVEILNLHQFS